MHQRGHMMVRPPDDSRWGVAARLTLTAGLVTAAVVLAWSTSAVLGVVVGVLGGYVGLVWLLLSTSVRHPVIRRDRDLDRALCQAFSTGSGLSELTAVAHLATDDALIDAWGATAALLVGLSTATKIGRLADIRGVLLDEFERRDLAGFRTWLTDFTSTVLGSARDR